MRQTLQVAKDDRRALTLGEAADLFIQDRKPLGTVRIRGRAGHRLDPAGLARLRRREVARARAATRRLTPWSHGPSESSTLTAEALRTSTRNVA